MRDFKIVVEGCGHFGLRRPGGVIFVLFIGRFSAVPRRRGERLRGRMVDVEIDWESWRGARAISAFSLV